MPETPDLEAIGDYCQTRATPGHAAEKVDV